MYYRYALFSLTPIVGQLFENKKLMRASCGLLQCCILYGSSASLVLVPAAADRWRQVRTSGGTDIWEPWRRRGCNKTMIVPTIALFGIVHVFMCLLESKNNTDLTMPNTTKGKVLYYSINTFLLHISSHMSSQRLYFHRILSNGLVCLVYLLILILVKMVDTTVRTPNRDP